MPLFELVLFGMATLATGLLAGLSAGLFGVGGGMIVVPVMVTLFKIADVPPDLAMHLAVGTSLATIIPTSIASFRTHAKHGKADLQLLRQWALAIILGAVLGGTLATYLSGYFLSLSFAVFASAIALYMGLSPAKLETRQCLPHRWEQKALALAIGLISALVGIGGGSMAVPAMVISGVPIHRAVGTASGLGALVALPATIIFMLSPVPTENLPPGTIGHVSWLAFAFLAPATMIAAPYGARWAHRLPPQILRRIFAVFLLIIALKMIDPFLH